MSSARSLRPNRGTRVGAAPIESGQGSTPSAESCSEPVNVRLLPFGGAEQRASIALRRAVLREPIGLDFRDEDLAAEDCQLHFGAFVAGELVGTLLLASSGDAVKMRQVAVAFELQGRGVGRALVDAFEQVARERGARRVALHARETAVPFYERLGYEAEGEPFVEVTLPHRVMTKRL